MNTSLQLMYPAAPRRAFLSGLRAGLLAAVAAFAAPMIQAQAPATSWWTMDDAAFAKKYAPQALGTSLTDQSSVAWMLFARVNQPKTTPTKATTWELWPSNEDTFSPAVATFAAASKVRTRPHLQTTKAHFILAQRKGLTLNAAPAGGGEEVTRNPISYGYIVANKLRSAAGVWKRVSTGPNLNFPIGAVEIKADWQTGALPGAYTTTDSDSDTVYSLVGLHIMVKFGPTPSDPFGSETPSWFWTTFEYNKNPGLTHAQTFLTYHDALTPAQSAALMSQAGLSQTAFANYVCNGTQIQYSDAKNKIIRMGNTTMENFAFTPTDAKTPADWTSWNISCHTCHGSGSTNGLGGTNNPVGGNLNVNPYFLDTIELVVGPLPKNVVAGYKSFDFVWSFWRAQ